ncbi:hypothetical protein [Arsenicibacter rosenii]|uniref:Uncharacterized protein n=1 Tax=Arsenicibacter rosenii TaxID=1750698 RepID=A0A1S2VLX8_9BACT|nr:hypothetical protein [Arsenicibacter rosenii]OIN59225.1 hypothetical protein BLX24_09540 [Arsenicibacter rosenii]
MKTLTRNAFFAFAAAAMMTACSRPYATVQRTQTERFYSAAKPAPAAEAKAVDVAVATPVEAPATTEAPTAAQVEATKQVVDQIEAYAANNKELASSKKLEKRMARVKQLLNEATTAKSLNTLQTTKKATLMERMMTKKIDKQIKKHMAPDEAKVMDRATRAGIIIGIVGLLLSLLFGGVLGLLGLLMLIGGIVLILVGVLRTV